MLVDPALSRPAGVPDAEARAQFRLHDRRRSRPPRSCRRTSSAPIRRASIPSRPPPTRRITSRWRRTARAGCCRWRRTPSRSSASSCSPPRRAATSTRRSRPSAPLEARPHARCASEVPHARRRPLPRTRHRGGDRARPLRRDARRGGRGAIACARLSGAMERASSGSGSRRARRRAADRQHAAYRHGDPARHRAAARRRRGWRARTPTGGSTGSTISRRRSARPCCAPRSRAPSST